MSGWQPLSSSYSNARPQPNASAGYNDAGWANEGEQSVAGVSLSSDKVNANLAFCVNPVLFEHCGLLLDSPSGLTTASIMRLRQESPTSTSISLGMWKDMAVAILGLTEAVAFSIFDVCYALTGGGLQSFATAPGGTGVASGAVPGLTKTLSEFRLDSSRALLNKMGGTFDERKWPAVSVSRVVSLPGLIIFLMAQVFLDRSPRAPLGEVNQSTLVSSVRQLLHEYISAVAVTRPGRVTQQDILELRILLREFAGGVEQPFGTSLAFLWPRNEATTDIAVLAQFIRPRILLLSEVTASLEPRMVSVSNNLVISDLLGTVYIPSSPLFSLPASKSGAGAGSGGWSSSSGGSKTVAPNAKLPSATFVIRRCTATSVYVASDVPNTRLSQLANCTIALGPVSGVLCVDRCENCNITALCSAIVVSNCKNVTLFICTNTPPVLCMHEGPHSLDQVRFAPYNSHYSTLEEHLASTGVNPKLNLWNAGLPSAQFLLPPENFTPLCFPIAPHAIAVITTRTNPCTLPWVYAEALQRRVDKFQRISRQLQEAYQRLEYEGRKDLAENLRTKVHAMFLEWIQQSGQSKGLVDLLHSQQQQPVTAANTSNTSTPTTLGGLGSLANRNAR